MSPSTIVAVLSRKETREAKFAFKFRCSYGPVAVRTSVSSKLRRPTGAWLQDLSDGFQQFYRIAFVQHAFYHDRTVNTGHALVSLRHFLQYRRRFLSSIGIESDHDAARIAFQYRHHHLRPDS